MSDRRVQEAFIKAEITAQLIALKRQIDIEIAADIANIDAKLRALITSTITEQLSASEARTSASVTALKKDVDAKVATAKNQIVLANNNQLATVQESTKQMIHAVGQQITNAAYKKVITEINRDIVPKVNSMVEYVNYQMQDAGELVTDYRREVHKQSEGNNKMITDGKASHIISEHVSLFFHEDN